MDIDDDAEMTEEDEPSNPQSGHLTINQNPPAIAGAPPIGAGVGCNQGVELKPPEKWYSLSGVFIREGGDTASPSDQHHYLLLRPEEVIFRFSIILYKKHLLEV